MNTSSSVAQSASSSEASTNDTSNNTSPKYASLKELVDAINSFAPWIEPDGTGFCKLSLADGSYDTCMLTAERIVHRVNAMYFDRGLAVNKKMIQTAISITLGKLDENRSTANAAPEPLLQAVVVFTKKEKEWTGSASTLLIELEKLLSRSDRQSLNLSADTLAKRLVKMKWPASQQGVRITQLARTKNERRWHILALEDANGANDADDADDAEKSCRRFTALSAEKMVQQTEFQQLSLSQDLPK